MRSILNILAKYNPECKDLLRQLKNLKLVRKDEYLEKSPSEIVKSFENWESF